MEEMTKIEFDKCQLNTILYNNGIFALIQKIHTRENCKEHYDKILSNCKLCKIICKND